MKKNFTLEMCRQYIEQNKQKKVFSAQPGSKLPQLLADVPYKNRVLLCVAPVNAQIILIPYDDKRHHLLYFQKGKLIQEGVLDSLKKYSVDSYQVWCYQLVVGEFWSWLEQNSAEEKVSIPRQDAEILKQHKIDIPPSGETTRRHLKDAYTKMKESGEKEEKNHAAAVKVLQKYCPSPKEHDTLASELELVLKQDEIVKIQEEHSQVFTKYGIKVPENITYKQFHETVKSHAPKHLGKTISAEDLEVFKKYGIQFSASGEVQGKVKLPPTRASKLKAMCYGVLLAAILAAFVWQFGWDLLKYYWHRGARTLEITRLYRQVERPLLQLQKETDEAEKLYGLILKEYPATEDYMEPHPKMQPIIKKGKGRLKQWQAQFRHGYDLLTEGKLDEAEKLGQQKETYLAQIAEDAQIIERVCKRLTVIQHTNKLLKDELLREERVHKALSNLRNYILQAGESLDLIEEKTALITIRYGADQESAPLDAKSNGYILKIRQKVEEFETAIRQIETAKRSDYKKAATLCAPYQSLQISELGNLRDIEETMSEVIAHLEKFHQNRLAKSDVNQMIQETLDRANLLKKHLDVAEQRLGAVEVLPTELNLPRPTKEAREILSKAQEEVKNLRTAITKANQLLDDKRINEAKNLVSQESSPKSVLPELLQVSENFLETIQKGEVLKVEKTEKTLRVSDLVAKAKRHCNSLQNNLANLPEEISSLAKEYAANTQAATKLTQYAQTVKKFVALQESEEKLLVSVSEKIQKQLLAEAQSILENNQPTVEQIAKASLQIPVLRGEIQKLVSVAKQEKERQLQLDRCQKVIAKIDRYTTRVKGILDPIDSDIMRLAQNYPASEGYPQLGEATREILKQSKKNLDVCATLAAKGKDLVKKNQIGDAFTLLVPYEGKSLSSPNFMTDITTLQNEITQKLQEAENLKRKKSKTGQVEQLLAEVRRRHDALNKIIPSLEKNLQTISPNYASIPHGYGLDPNAQEYLRDGKNELAALTSLLGSAEQQIRQQKYSAAIELLQPFSDAESKGYTLLPPLTTLLAISERIMQQFQDPKQKALMEAKVKMQKDRQARIKNLARVPGVWYQDVDKALGQYESMNSKIIEAVKENATVVVTALDSQVQKLKEYPQDIAQVDYLLAFFQEKGKRVEINPDSLSDKDLEKYIKTKSIELDIAEEVAEIKGSVGKLQNELRLGGWVEEETLRTFLRNVKSIDRKYQEVYKNIRNPLLNLEAQIPN